MKYLGFSAKYEHLNVELNMASSQENCQSYTPLSYIRTRVLASVVTACQFVLCCIPLHLKELVALSSVAQSTKGSLFHLKCSFPFLTWGRSYEIRVKRHESFACQILKMLRICSVCNLENNVLVFQTTTLFFLFLIYHITLGRAANALPTFEKPVYSLFDKPQEFTTVCRIFYPYYECDTSEVSIT